MGSTGAVTPTPNRGGEAAAIQVLGNVAQLLTHALTQAGATSELGGKILDLLTKVSKIAPPGSSSPAGQKNVMDQAQLRNAQQNQMAQQLRQRMMQGGGGGGGGGLPGAGGGGPPMAA
jgi:hypothetical protein